MIGKIFHVDWGASVDDAMELQDGCYYLQKVTLSNSPHCTASLASHLHVQETQGWVDEKIKIKGREVNKGDLPRGKERRVSFDPELYLPLQVMQPHHQHHCSCPPLAALLP